MPRGSIVTGTGSPQFERSYLPVDDRPGRFRQWVAHPEIEALLQQVLRKRPGPQGEERRRVPGQPIPIAIHLALNHFLIACSSLRYADNSELYSQITHFSGMG